MIKNGRPYSCENGYTDKKLITDQDYLTIKKVSDWIKDNIERADTVNDKHTSYSLKHRLQADTGVYLTNNEFKDAMLLAGYVPVNENELNWKYCFVLKEKINRNPNPFFRWIISEFADKDSSYGDLADDISVDYDFPAFANYEIIKEYLECHNACDEALQTFEEAWKLFEEDFL